MGSAFTHHIADLYVRVIWQLFKFAHFLFDCLVFCSVLIYWIFT